MTCTDTASRQGSGAIPSTTKEQIESRAAALFCRQGYSATSLRNVADAVGLSKAGLYHYFPSKEALLNAIASRALTVLRCNLTDVLSMPGGVERKLHELVVGRVELIVEEQEVLTVLWQERVHLSSETYGHITVLMREYRKHLIDLIREGQETGAVSPSIDPEMGMMALVGITGWVYHWYNSAGRLRPHQIGEELWSCLRYGIFTAPSGYV